MSSAITLLNDWSPTWSTLLIAMLWQSTLVAVLVAAVCRLLRRNSPAVRYWLWQIVAIKLLLIPLWTIAVPVPWMTSSTSLAELPSLTAATPRVEEDVSDTASVHSVQQTTSSIPPESRSAGAIGPSEPAADSVRTTWATRLMVAWGICVVAQILLLLWQRARLVRLLHQTSVADHEIVALVADCAKQIGLRRAPRVLAIDERCSPFVCGVWRPRLVLPAEIELLVPRDQLSPVLIHELAHIQRRDLLWNWLPQLARMLYFFHPVAHWVVFRTRLEAELACDGCAMSNTGRSPGAYAELLVRVVSKLSEPPLLASGSIAAAGLDGQMQLRQRSERTQPHIS